MSHLQKKKSFDALEVIADVMNNDNFRRLFNENFNSMPETKSVVLMMKLYQFLEIMHQEHHGYVHVPKEIIIEDIRKIFSNNETRRLFFKNTEKIFESDENGFRILSKQNELQKFFCIESIHLSKQQQITNDAPK
jgi:hypothetical protein